MYAPQSCLVLQMEVNALIKKYFKLGFSNKEILEALALFHGHVLSIRTLKRRTKEEGLFRRKCHSDLFNVALFIVSECEGPGQMQGYRWIHARCLENGYSVTQETVRILLHIVDPEGVCKRQKHRLKRRKYINPGPNSMWHIDGYDKLAKYGIYIHGCVDGFSRYILWLHAYHTNKDSSVIAGYFLECVINLQKGPARIRCDRGTENVHVEQIQKFLRRHGTDGNAGNNSFIYGSSVNNQRIEWMWGMIRRQGMQFWLNFFQKMCDENQFNRSYLDLNLVQFCFTDMVQVRAHEQMF